jgi:hypothetical protein
MCFLNRVPLRTISRDSRAKVGSLPGLLVPEKATMSRDPLKAYTTLKAP